MSVELYARQSDRSTGGLLTSWSQLSLIQRRNDVGRWLLTLHSADDAALLGQGSGLVIRRDGEVLDSGWRWPKYDITATGADVRWLIGGDTDTVIMQDTLCWPQPTQPIGSQTDRDFVTALNVPASNRVRTFFLANTVNRLAVPGAAVEPPAHLGPQGRSRARFRELLDLAQEICGQDVNFQVRHRASDRALVLTFWEPEDKRLDIQFSPEVGTVHAWTFADAGPESTRVIIGCGDEEEGRVFRQRTASQAGLVGSRESDWGNVRRRETFLDARDLKPDDEEVDLENEARNRGDAELTDKRRRQSFSVDVTDLPDEQTFGTHFGVGDLVRAYAVPGVPVDDLIEQVEWTVDADGGERTKVWIGPVDDPQERNARRERDMRRMIKNLETRL